LNSPGRQPRVGRLISPQALKGRQIRTDLSPLRGLGIFRPRYPGLAPRAGQPAPFQGGYTSTVMTITIPDSILESARMSESELRQEIAVLLYEKEKLTLAQASRLAEMDRVKFQHLIASRGLTMHYGVEELEQDLATLRGLA